ncbi:hypothetical protein KNN17_16600 [Arthrobacter bambusae]|uniref:hypothetical protein n=1 Tax=Arthrobacter bambusae TaxID=1338426 RepID=UPI001F50BEE1|nr:hypothetical protein [Arthrobacter bambusae]MCI0143187.1 hypothetical protein [Arthrobacter bambusae]
MAFGVQLGQFTCLAVYIFVGDRLVRGKYRIRDEYQNRNHYLTSYDELKESVTKKYDSPVDDKTYWLNDMYQNDFSGRGMAVACGHLRKFAKWETQESTVTVAVHGENFDVTVAMEYSGKAFAGLEDAITESALLENLWT